MGIKSFLNKAKDALGGGAGVLGFALGAIFPVFGAVGGLAGWFSGQTLLYRAVLGATLLGRGGKRKFSGAPSRTYGFGTADNAAAVGAALPVVFGETRVVGLRVWQRVAGNTMKALIALCDGEVAEVADVRVDGQPVEGVTGAAFNAYTGAPGQMKSSVLDGYRAGIASLAAVDVDLTANDEVGANPVVTARVKGRKVPVWTGSQFEEQWTDNPAWIVRHLLLEGGHDAADLDDASFIAFADHCSETIPGEYEITMTNLAPGATMAPPSPTPPGYIAGGEQRANDRRTAALGDASDTWGRFGDAGGDVVEMGTMDFGAAKRIGRIFWHWWAGDDRTFAKLRVDYFDGVGWQTLIDRTDKDYKMSGRTVLNESEFLVPFVQTEKLRFFASGEGPSPARLHPYITEIEVWEAVPARRFTCNLVMDHQRPLRDWIDDVLAACNAFLTTVDGGRVGVDYEQAKVASFAFTEDNVAEGGFRFREIAQEQRPNRVRFTYFDRTLHRRRQVQFDHTAGQDATGVRTLELELLNVTHGGQAARLARLLTNIASQVRFAATVQGLPGATLSVLPGDVVTLTHRVAGWTGKPFLVDSVTPSEHGVTTFDLLEYRPEIFSDTAGGWTRAELDTHLQSPLDGVAHPTGVSVNASQRQLKDGSFLPVIVVSFTLPAAVDRVEVQLSSDGGATYEAVGQAAVSPFEIAGVQEGSYQVRLVSVNRLGVRAGTLDAPVAGLTVDGKLSPPSGPSAPTASYTGALVRLSWQAPADKDLLTFEVRRSQNPAEPWSSATAVVSDLRATGLDVSAETLGTSARGPWTFQVRAKDRSGNGSALSGGQALTFPAVQNAAPTGFAGTALTVQEAPPTGHRLTWPALTNHADLDRYEVHRGTSAGFTPSAGTLVATVRQGHVPTGAASVSVDVPFAPGDPPGTVYYYRVQCLDVLSDQVGDQFSAATRSAEGSGVVRLVDARHVSDALAVSVGRRGGRFISSVQVFGEYAYFYNGTVTTPSGSGAIYRVHLASGVATLWFAGLTQLDGLTVDPAADGGGGALYTLEERQVGGGFNGSIVKRFTGLDQATGTQDTSSPWGSGGLALGRQLRNLAFKETITGGARFYSVATDVTWPRDVYQVDADATPTTTLAFDAKPTLSPDWLLTSGGEIFLAGLDYHPATGHLWLVDQESRLLHTFTTGGTLVATRVNPGTTAPVGLTVLHDEADAPVWAFVLGSDGNLAGMPV